MIQYIVLVLIFVDDPIADFINGATADVIEFTSNLLFEQFKNQTEKLNKMETYPQVMNLCENWEVN